MVRVLGLFMLIISISLHSKVLALFLSFWNQARGALVPETSSFVPSLRGR